jgi:hypothetical protein
MYIDPKVALERSKNPANLIIKHRNMQKTTAHRTEDEKVFLGTMGILTGSPYEVEKTFGAAHTRVKEYSQGIDNQRIGRLNTDLRDKVEEAVKTTKEKISDKALDVLTNALGLVGERLENKQVGKTTDISTIAKDMATIYDKINPKDISAGLGIGIQVVINAPAQKGIKEYEMVEG